MGDRVDVARGEEAERTGGGAPSQRQPKPRVEVEGIVIPVAFEELAEELRMAGYEPHLRPGIERRGGPAAWELLLWVRDHLAPAAALSLAGIAGRWSAGAVRHIGMLRDPCMFGCCTRRDGRKLAEVRIEDEKPGDG